MGKDLFCGESRLIFTSIHAFQVGTRTKRECMLRFKELAEAMKAKKLAMAKAAKAAGK